MDMGTGSSFQCLLGPAPLPWTERTQGQEGPCLQARPWHPGKPPQAGSPTSLPFKDRLCLSRALEAPRRLHSSSSPGTLAGPGVSGPGVSAGLPSSLFPGQQGKAGPGERWLCWVFRVGHCPVCPAAGFPREQRPHLDCTRTQVLPWTEVSSPAVWTCQAVTGRSMGGTF